MLHKQQLGLINMHDLQDLYNYTPLTSGEVYRNSKTKIFTDGTTNTIVSRASIFKDSDVLTEHMEFKNEQKEIDIQIERGIVQDQIEQVYNILNRCNLKSYQFSDISNLEQSPDFLIKLAEVGMSVNEYDFINAHFNKIPKKPKEHIENEPRNDSMKRAKDQIFDYIMNNDFEYFFTGTINPEYFDSEDPKELLKPVQSWLKNMVQRYNMEYILIAERHKNGGIHFHGLLKADKSLKLIDSGTKLYKGYNKPVSDEKAEELGLTGGRTVYNLKSWSFGFTTCVPLVGDRMNTAFYVTKYITKECKKIFGKFFWHSRGLKKPLIVLQDMDYDSIECVETNGFKYIFRRGADSETV